MVKLAIFFMWTILLVESSVINDDVCDNQLKYFDDALTNRDHWAVYG